MPLIRTAIASSAATGASVLILACNGSSSDAQRFAQALEAPDGAQALGYCAEIREDALREECVAGAVRLHPSEAAACLDLHDPRWAGECHFSVAEALAPERWEALEACAQAGPYLQECLYHLWTSELSHLLEASHSAPEAVPTAIEIVAFWSSADHLVSEPETQLWRDFWYFAIRHHGPADLAWCSELGADLETHCRSGLEAGVQRALVDLLENPSTPEEATERACRSGAFDPSLLDAVARDQPPLRASADRAAELACMRAAGEPIPRWNPTFRELRP